MGLISGHGAAREFEIPPVPGVVASNFDYTFEGKTYEGNNSSMCVCVCVCVCMCAI